VTPTIVFTPTHTATPTPAEWITLTAPNGGEVLTVGDVYRITWQSSPNVGRVNLGVISRYTCAGCPSEWFFERVIASLYPNTGYYDWLVSVDDPTNKEFIVLVEGIDEIEYTILAWDYSDEPFDVLPLSVPTSTVTITSTMPMPTPTPTLCFDC
jgi:hypothetical protein